MTNSKLHVREIQIINTLFSSDSPLTSLEIVTKNPGLSQSTVQTILRKLLEKELVEVAGTVYSGNVLARSFRGTKKAKEKALMYMVDEYQKISDAVSISELAEAMAETEADIEKKIHFLKEVLRLTDQEKAD